MTRPIAGNLTLEVKSASGEVQTHTFDAAADRRVIIGRANTCDLVIQESGASRKHTMLLCTYAGWRVEDLGSSNGTRLNSKQVKSSPVEHGDVLQIGQTEIRLIQVTASEARLVVDLLEGRASFDTHALPLSAAELIWFGFLSLHRSDEREGL